MNESTEVIICLCKFWIDTGIHPNIQLSLERRWVMSSNIVIKVGDCVINVRQLMQKGAKPILLNFIILEKKIYNL